MLLSRRYLTAWTLANVFTASTFLYFASWTWLEPNLRGEGVARGGDVVIWALSAFPILLVAFAANLIWLAMVARERRKAGLRWPSAFLTIVAGVWISAVLVDRLRF
jgi:hypothetical protein